MVVDIYNGISIEEVDKLIRTYGKTPILDTDFTFKQSKVIFDDDCIRIEDSCDSCAYILTRINDKFYADKVIRYSVIFNHDFDFNTSDLNNLMKYHTSIAFINRDLIRNNNELIEFINKLFDSSTKLGALYSHHKDQVIKEFNYQYRRFLRKKYERDMLAACCSNHNQDLEHDLDELLCTIKEDVYCSIDIGSDYNLQITITEEKL